ncbi:MAG: protein prkA [Candidatus Saccharimonadales bacterium]
MSGEIQKKHSVFEDFNSYSDSREALKWEGDFSEYIEKVMEKPELVRTAFHTAHAALTANPNYFTTGKNALYGAERTTNHFIEILKGGAEGLEIGKRIILLLGPPGSGKSTLVNGTKRALEEYSYTDEGAMYAIADCPMNEEPMHLIPEALRSGLAENYDINIEGDLCPHCEAKYGNASKPNCEQVTADDLKQVPVKRIFISEKNRSGIGTFKPSDPKSQDIADLIGSVDVSALGEYGSASDARAYRFDGEFNVANRGMMEFVEILKSDEKFLYSLLDLTQDRFIKASRYANTSVDEVIVAHTNLAEYDSYVKNPKNEALRDRMIVVACPYPLRVSDERQVYEKLIGQSDIAKRTGMHINPNTLEVAAMFSVLSRLEGKGKYSKLQKMQIYDGKSVDGLSQRDLKELRETSTKEGMHGISPRFVIDSLSSSLIKKDPVTNEPKKCFTPIDAIRALEENLDHHAHTRDMDEESKKAFKEDMTIVRKLYNDKAKEQVNESFIHAYADSAETLANKYLENVALFCTQSKTKDEFSDDEYDPDEKLMRSIEEQIRVTENGKKEFRQEIMNSMARASMTHKKFEYTDHPNLAKAVKNKLQADVKDIVKMTTNASIPDKKQQGRIDKVVQTLIEDHGHCEHCAIQLVKHVGQMTSRSE